jgi:GNAT superfamily N-acetyltransferase
VKLGFRPARPEETSCTCGGIISPDNPCTFIIATWSSSYKKSHSAGVITTDDWAPVMHIQLAKMMARTDARAIVAYEKTDPDFLYGWIAGDTSENTPVVYYTYVKESYRKSGIARALFRAFGVDPSQYFVYVCGTPDAIQLSRKIPRARFNPNEVRYPKENRRRPL